MDESRYQKMRECLLMAPEQIIELERHYMDFFTEVVLDSAEAIYTDFGKSADLLPFWINYPPRQRGRAFSGTAVPWGDMGEKAVSASVIRTITQKSSEITYPGLPSGADLRFATPDALIHFDFKLTGPNDRDDEVVASPNQISGNGKFWEQAESDRMPGVRNSIFKVVGPKGGTMNFEPTLPPLYEIDGNKLACLTYFLKVVYRVEDFGDQPLDHMELVCVPNGLLMFDGETYATKRGLLIPGKDDKTVETGKRVRVRFDPLSEIAGWRVVRFTRNSSGQWQAHEKDEPGLF